jgi:hypothetical protein
VHANIDPTFVESVVGVLVAIHRRAERDELIGWGTVPMASPIDVALSTADLEATTDAAAPAEFAADGGDDRLAKRDTDEGLLVAVDLRGVDRNDHETEVDASGDSLVLTIAQRVAWRVPVEGDPRTITDVSVNNDVLEVRVGIDR